MSPIWGSSDASVNVSTGFTRGYIMSTLRDFKARLPETYACIGMLTQACSMAPTEQACSKHQPRRRKAWHPPLPTTVTHHRHPQKARTHKRHALTKGTHSQKVASSQTLNKMRLKRFSAFRRKTLWIKSHADLEATTISKHVNNNT